MTLERVGSGAGPDLETLADVRIKAPRPSSSAPAASATRPTSPGQRDAGAGAWLVASALHDGRLPRVRA